MENYKRRLINYFKRNISKGYNPETLKWALINQGYSKILVENALIQVNKELNKKTPKTKEKPKIKYEIIGEDNKPIKIKKPLWKKIFDR